MAVARPYRAHAMRTSSNPASRKQRVNMTLDAELVRAVRPYAPNLSETVERLLAEHLEKVRRASSDKEARIDAAIDDCNEFLARYGSLSDDYPSTL